MNPSRMQKLDAEADQLIQGQHTEEGVPLAEPAVDAQPGAQAQTEQVEPNTDQGVPATEPAADIQTQDTGEIDRLTAELEKSEQRYKSLMGMINKRDSENDSLRQLVAQLTQKIDALSKPEQAPAKTQLVTDDDIKEFGVDMIDVVRRTAREIVEAELGKLKGSVAGDIKQLTEQVNTVADVTVKTAQERFNDALTGQVADWESINIDPKFIAYLQENDWLEGLNAAYAAGDLANTAKFFLRYKSSLAPVAPPAPAAKPDAFVAPGKSRSTPPPQSDGGRQWTPADINKLYDDQSRGKISEAEFNKLEADLFKAQREGRFAA